MKKTDKRLMFLAATLAIVGIGLLLRFRFVFSHALWQDEAFYFKTSQDSLRNILTISYWFKDNPFLFFLFLKLWSTVSISVLWLRFSGIISFVFSFYLINKLFIKIGTLRLLVLAFFSLSPFFIHLNSWISPYNLLLIVSLAQILLLLRYFEGKFKKQEPHFLCLFTLGNLLAINIHYSALYLYAGYAAILIYFFFFQKKLFKMFFLSLILSSLIVVPNIIFVIKNFNRIAGIFPSKFPLEFSSPVGLLFYIFKIASLSIARTESRAITILLIIGLFAIIIFIAFRVLRAFRVIIRNSFLVFFLAFFVAPIFAMFFLKLAGFEILNERNFTILHIGFYFLVAGILWFLRDVSKFLFIFILSFLLLILGFSGWSFVRGKSFETIYIPGNIFKTQYLQNKDYQTFLGELSRRLKANNYDSLVVWGFNEMSNYQDYIFINYYLPNSRVINEVLGKRSGKIVVRQAFPQAEAGLCRYINNTKERFFIINFATGDQEPECFKNAEVVEFWDFFRK